MRTQKQTIESSFMKKVGLSLVLVALLSGCASAGAQVLPEPPPTEAAYTTQEGIVIPDVEATEEAEDNLVTAQKAPTPKPKPTPKPTPEPQPEKTVEVEEPEEEASDSGDSDSSSDSGNSGSGDSGNDSKPDPSVPMPTSEVKKYAYQQVMDKWGNSSEFTCLENLWEKESNWRHTAQNPSSGAYGIPQSLPGNKMATHGSDWRTNPKTQIDWGLDYIKGRYGAPCGAWGHSQRVGWY